MKKFILFFSSLFILIALTGCKQESDTVRFNPDENQPSQTETDDSNPSDTEDDPAMDADTQEDAASDADNNQDSDASDTQADSESQRNKIKLAVTSFIGNSLKTTRNQVEIQGIAPLQAQRLTINGKETDQFSPGEKDWAHTVSIAEGNLKAGKNSYSVIAMDENGGVLDTLNFNINYQSPDSTDQLPSTGLPLVSIFSLSILFSAAYVYRKELFQKNI